LKPLHELIDIHIKKADDMEPMQLVDLYRRVLNSEIRCIERTLVINKYMHILNVMQPSEYHDEAFVTIIVKEEEAIRYHLYHLGRLKQYLENKPIIKQRIEGGKRKLAHGKYMAENRILNMPIYKFIFKYDMMPTDLKIWICTKMNLRTE